MELWDAFDRDLNLIDGVTMVRGEPIPEGCYHLVCEIAVRHRDGTWLVMQRDPRKAMGGMWELTAGGSAIKGEDPLTCARRELREETGIDCPDLTELGRVVHLHYRTIYEEYLCVTDRDKDDITLQEGETVAWRWVTGDELMDMARHELCCRRTLTFIPELNP